MPTTTEGAWAIRRPRNSCRVWDLLILSRPRQSFVADTESFMHHFRCMVRMLSRTAPPASSPTLHTSPAPTEPRQRLHRALPILSRVDCDNRPVTTWDYSQALEETSPSSI